MKAKVFFVFVILVITSLPSLSQDKNLGKSSYTNDEVKRMCGGISVAKEEREAFFKQHPDLFKSYVKQNDTKKQTESLVSNPAGTSNSVSIQSEIIDWSVYTGYVDNQGNCGDCYIPGENDQYLFYLTPL